MATLDEQVAAIKEEADKKIKQLKAKQELLDNKKLHALIKGKRADDTRRKILAGALVLDMIEKDEAARVRFIGHLDKFLTRPDDRALFDLSGEKSAAKEETAKPPMTGASSFQVKADTEI